MDGLPLIYLSLIWCIMIISFNGSVAVTFSSNLAFTTDLATEITVSKVDPLAVSLTIEARIFHPHNDPFFLQSSTRSPIPPIAFQWKTSIGSGNLDAESSKDFNQYDSTLKLYYFVFSKTSSWRQMAYSTASVRYYLPHPLPVCIYVTSNLPSSSSVDKYCTFGHNEIAPGFSNHFPVSMYLPTDAPNTIRARIGNLGAFSDVDSDLYRTIGFQFSLDVSLNAIPVSVYRAWDADGNDQLSTQIIVNNNNGIVSFGAALPKTTQGHPVQTIEIEFTTLDLTSLQTNPTVNWVYFDLPSTTSLLASGKLIPIALDKTIDTNLDGLEHVSTVVSSTPSFFHGTPGSDDLGIPPHTELVETIRIDRRGTKSSTKVYLASPLHYLFDSFFVSCQKPATTPQNDLIFSGSFTASPDRWHLITISWGTQTSLILECTRVISYLAAQIAPEIDLDSASGGIHLAIGAEDGIPMFKTLIPQQTPSLLAVLGTSSPSAPIISALPLFYGGTANSWVLSIIEPGAFFPFPSGLFLQFKGLNIAASGLPSVAPSWLGSNPSSSTEFRNLNPRQKSVVRGDSASFLIFLYSLLSDQKGVVINPEQKIQFASNYDSIPGKTNDPFTLLSGSGIGANQDTDPFTVDIGFTRDDDNTQRFYSAPIFRLPTPHLPDLTLSWPEGVPNYDFTNLDSIITLIGTFKSRPLFYPTDPLILTPNSVWVTSPNVIIYPGSHIDLDFVYIHGQGNVRTITNAYIRLLGGLQDLTVANLAGTTTFSLTNLTPDPIVIPNDKPDIIFEIDIILDGPIPYRAEIDCFISIKSSFTTQAATALPSPPAPFSFGTAPGFKPIALSISLPAPGSEAIREWTLDSSNWVEAEASTQLSPQQTLPSNAQISFISIDPTNVAPGFSIKLDLFYYLQLGTDEQPSYAPSPVHLTSLGELADQTDTTPTSLANLLPAGQTQRGYSRVIFRATYTITTPGDSLGTKFIQDYEFFITILPSCWAPVEQSSWSTPPNSSHYSVSCAQSTPICTQRGVCLSTSTAQPPVQNPDITNICSTCHPDNSVRCTPSNTAPLQPCECKNTWTGPTCSQSVECEVNARSRCVLSNGFIQQSAIDTCEGTCTCYNEWIGSKCQICPMRCSDHGIPYNDCRRCGCSTGFTGDKCECQQVSGSITLNYGKKNALFESSNGYFLTSPVRQTPFIIDHTTGANGANGATIPGYLVDEFNVELFDFGIELYQGLVSSLLGNPNGKFALHPVSIPSPSDEDYTQTKFSFSITFGCLEYNPNIKTTDDLKERWSQFTEQFIRLDVIQKYFGVDVEQSSSEPDPTPPTLPPDDETYTPVTDPDSPANSAALPGYFTVCLFLGIIVMNLVL